MAHNDINDIPLESMNETTKMIFIVTLIIHKNDKCHIEME